MNKVFPRIILACFFFVFVIPDVSPLYLSWDRAIPQFLYLTTLNIISLCYLFKIGLLNETINNVYNKQIIMCYSVFVIICFISILFAENQIESIVTISKYLSYLFTLLCIYSLANYIGKSYINFIIYIVAFSLFIESISLVYNTLDMIYIKEIGFARDNELLRTFSGNINVGANSLIYKISFLFYLIYKTDKLKLLSFLYFILFLVFSSLFILLSRSSFIGLSIVMLVFFIWANKRHIYKSGIITAVLISSYLFVQTSINADNPNEITDRISSISINTQDDSVDERFRYYSHALHSISINPLFGIGIGNWKLKSIEYDASDIEGYIIPYHAHNDFLQIAAEIGIIGLVFFMMIIIIPSYNILLKIFNKEIKLFELVILLSIVAYVIDSMLNFPIARPMTHIYLLFILVSYMIHKNYKIEIHETV
ncbi:MAG: O-antigen ligase family protein [Cytophagales bacterium]